MYIKNNIKSKGVLNISKFYLLDFSKIKICRPTKIHIGAQRNRLVARGKPSTWFPRGRLLSRYRGTKHDTTQHNITQHNTIRKHQNTKTPSIHQNTTTITKSKLVKKQHNITHHRPVAKHSTT